MSHVCIKRLSPGNSKHGRAHRKEALERVVDEHVDGMVGAQRPNYVWMLRDAEQTKNRYNREIDEHHRAEQRCHLGRSAALNHEQEHQDTNYYGHDQRTKARFVNGNAFDRAEH